MQPAPLDLTPYLHQEEGQFFDRKSLLHGPPGQKKTRKRSEVRDEIAEYVAAFANAEGGVLILGQEDDFSLTGHAYPSEALEEMLATPERRLTPPQARGWIQEVEGCEVLVFSVTSTPRAVQVVGDGFPRRVKDQVIQDSEEAINALKRRGQVESYESDLLPGVGLDALDLSMIQDAAKAAGLPASDPEGYLLARLLAERRGSDMVLRRGALLLFGASPQVMDHPNCGVRIFRVNGSERLTGTRNNVSEVRPRIEGSAAKVIRTAYDKLATLIGNSERLHNLFFKEMPEYPTFAWQEALVNAVAHRDYREMGRGVEVWLFSDRMEVRSPGELLPSVTLESLKGRKPVHASRNPRMTRVLAELGLMREQGEGVPRMFDEMEESWLPMPELASGEGQFMVTLRNVPVFEGGRPEWLAFVRELPLNIRQQRILAKNEAGAFRSGEYQDLNDVDRDQAYRELKVMVEAGYLEGPDHPGQGAVYRVKVTLTSRPKEPSVGPSGSIQAFRGRMESKGFVKNRDYQDCFGTERQTATKALADLVDGGVLTRAEGERRYKPGPHWESWGRAAQ